MQKKKKAMLWENPHIFRNKSSPNDQITKGESIDRRKMDTRELLTITVNNEIFTRSAEGVVLFYFIFPSYGQITSYAGTGLKRALGNSAETTLNKLIWIKS